MKSINKKSFDNLIKALKTTYLERENIHVSDHWKIRVLNNIRVNTFYDAKLRYFDLFQQFVWKIAPVACILIIILGIAITRIDFLANFKLFKTLINDPSDLSIFSLFS